MVSAWACGNGVVLGQVKTEEKSNEITAVPELLDKLGLSGCIVTLDAMGCQRRDCEAGQGKGRGLRVGGEGNQKQLDKELWQYCDPAREKDFEYKEIQNDETAEDDHDEWLSR